MRSVRLSSQGGAVAGLCSEAPLAWERRGKLATENFVLVAGILARLAHLYICGLVAKCQSATALSQPGCRFKKAITRGAHNAHIRLGRFWPQVAGGIGFAASGWPAGFLNYARMAVGGGEEVAK